MSITTIMDHHGHEHDHGPSVTRRLRHAVSDVFGGHSHYAADQVDESMEVSGDVRRAVWISLAVLIATAAVQALVVILAGLFVIATIALSSVVAGFGAISRLMPRSLPMAFMHVRTDSPVLLL